eukprot:573789-Alexandrium_andersonii.AAC.1
MLRENTALRRCDRPAHLPNGCSDRSLCGSARFGEMQRSVIVIDAARRAGLMQFWGACRRV